MLQRTLLLTAGFLLLVGAVGNAAETAGWRTDGSGVYPKAAPPTTWAKDKGVVWCTKMPTSSNASPVLAGEKLFVCSEPGALLCINRADGKILWKQEVAYADVITPEEKEKLPLEQKEAEAILKELGPVDREIPMLNKKLSTGSAARDEMEKKVATLKTQLEELKKKLQGEQKSAEDIQKESAPIEKEIQELQQKVTDENAGMEAAKKKIPELKAQAAELRKKLSTLTLNIKYSLPEKHGATGYTTCSPVCNGTHVFVLYGTGLVACYDLEGNRVWLKLFDQPKSGYGHSASPLLSGDKLLIHFTEMLALNIKDGSEVWRAKVATGFGSPVLAKVGETEVAITSKGSMVRVQDGKVLADKLCALEYCAPIVHDGVAYFIQTAGKALKLPEQAADVLKPEVLWKTSPKSERYYASPVYHDGLIYAINQLSIFSAIDAKNGQVVYEKQLDLGKGTVYPSLALAGNLIFASSDNGTTLIIEPGREYKEVAKNVLDGFRSTPVFDGKRMYLRTIANLYCIGD